MKHSDWVDDYMNAVGIDCNLKKKIENTAYLDFIDIWMRDLDYGKRLNLNPEEKEKVMQRIYDDIVYGITSATFI